MTDNNALTIYGQFDQLQRAAIALQESGFFPDVKSKAQAIVKVMAGAELGLPPFASMTGIHIIQGKPALGANLIATLVKNDPRYDYRVKKCDDSECVLEWYENGERVGSSSFTMAEAQKITTKENDKVIKLSEKVVWRFYPSDLLFARAVSRGARRFAPGIFGGSPVYTPEELGADVDEEGNVIDGQIREVTEPTKEQPKAPQPQANGSRPYAPLTVKDKVWQKAETYKTFTPSDKQYQLLRYGLELAFAGDEAVEDKRHTVLFYLTGKQSSKDIPGNFFKAIVEDWLGMEKDSGGEYIINPHAASEAQMIYTEALRAEGQQEMPIE